MWNCVISHRIKDEFEQIHANEQQLDVYILDEEMERLNERAESSFLLLVLIFTFNIFTRSLSSLEDVDDDDDDAGEWTRKIISFPLFYFHSV